MYIEINELEFIGESLPKINSNFKTLSDETDELNVVATHYSSLSGFYSTHSNNVNLDFIRVPTVPAIGNATYNKLSLLLNSGINLTKIIYPISIYVYIQNQSEINTPTINYRTRKNPASNFVSLLDITTPSAKGSGITNSAYSMLTFTDLGYFDWNIIINSLNANISVVMDVKVVN